MTGDDPTAARREAVGARFEALAAVVVAAAAPLRFEVARSPELLSGIFRLRRDVVIEKGWAAADALGPEGDCDRWDEAAIHIAGWDGPVLVAASRLVLPADGQLLPAEEAFDIRVDHASTAELGRAAVVPVYRGAVRRALWPLLCRSWLELRVRGYTNCAAVVTASLERLYRIWLTGFEITSLAAAREHRGELRHPVLMRPYEMPPRRRLQGMPKSALVIPPPSPPVAHPPRPAANGRHPAIRACRTR